MPKSVRRHVTDVSYCEGLPCIPTVVPPSVHRSLYLSPRPSAPTTPPNCCLMVQLLCNTLEHRLRDQGSCDGSIHGSTFKSKEERWAQKQESTTEEDFYLSQLNGLLWKIQVWESVTFKPVFCGRRLKGLQQVQVLLVLPSCPRPLQHLLCSTIAVCLCSVQATTYSIDWLYFLTFTDRIYLSCMSGFTPWDM